MEKFQELIQGTTPILVDYFAPWCGPCKMMHPVLEEVKKQLGERLKIIKVDIDQPNNRQNVNLYGVQAVPTLILFKAGKVVWRQSGAIPAPQLKQILEQYI